MTRARGSAPLCAICAGGLLVACGAQGSRHEATPPSGSRPNILFVVWDTVRADHLSLYGHDRPTTPFLARWAREARVFEDCVSISSTTVPAHASMFTGTAPAEHGVHNEAFALPPRFETLAELLRRHGYATYLFSANPYIGRVGENPSLAQGFDVVEHPWSQQFGDEALQILRRRLVSEDRSSELPTKLDHGTRPGKWDLKLGDHARRGMETWLGRRDPEQPFFAFINFMEAHRPLIPTHEHRREMMTPEQVRRSYAVDRSWRSIWLYTFGLKDFTPAELELTSLTYDAAIADLDELLRGLLESLEVAGYVEDTVVVLTSDHGEHLGEHHLVEHQFSLYEELLRVPLVLSFPGRVTPGREPRPVMNVDILPTLLELADIEIPDAIASRTRSLLHPRSDRVRVAEYPTVLSAALAVGREASPEFEEGRWTRSLRAIYEGPHKLIRASDGTRQLFHLPSDPHEARNRLLAEPRVAARLTARLHAEAGRAAASPPEWIEVPADLRHRLEVLGYVEPASVLPAE